MYYKHCLLLPAGWTRHSFSWMELVAKYSSTHHPVYHLCLISCISFERIGMKTKREVVTFWLHLLGWGVLSLLITMIAYDYYKSNTLLSYFWCGVIAFGYGAGVIYFPLVTMINIIFTQERMK